MSGSCRSVRGARPFCLGGPRAPPTFCLLCSVHCKLLYGDGDVDLTTWPSMAFSLWSQPNADL